MADGIRYDQTQRVIDGNGKILVTNPSNPATGGYVTEQQLKNWVTQGIDMPAKEDKSNKTQTINSSSTTTQYPSAKAVYDQVKECIKIGDSEVSDVALVNADTLANKAASEYALKSETPSKADLTEQQYAIDNLKAMTEGKTHNTYTETTTNGTKTLTSSAEVAPYAEVNKVLGKSVCWNQMVKDAFTDSTKWRNPSGTLDLVDGVAKIQVSKRTYNCDARSIDQYAPKANHVYFISVDLKRDSAISAMDAYIHFTSSSISVTAEVSETFTNVCGVIKETSANQGYLRINGYSSSGSGYLYAKNFRYFDLTKMFGVTSESQVTDGMKAWIKSYVEAHPSYEEGKILNLKGAITIKSEGGRNLWNEQTELGGINVAGDDVSASDRLRSVGYTKVTAGSRIYVSSPYILYLKFYDANKTALTSSWDFASKNEAKTVPSNASYFRFVIQNTYGTTYNHDICINISDSANGTYSKYMTDSIRLKDSITLRSAGTVRDEYCPETGKIQRKGKEIVLDGSEAWDVTGSFFYLNDSRFTSIMNGDCGNYYTSNRFPYNYSYGGAGFFIISSGDLYIGSSLASQYDSIASFKADLSAHHWIINASLITPTEETEESINRFLKVEKGGTITVSSNESYGDAEITYQTQITSTT